MDPSAPLGYPQTPSPRPQTPSPRPPSPSRSSPRGAGPRYRDDPWSGSPARPRQAASLDATRPGQSVPRGTNAVPWMVPAPATGASSAAGMSPVAGTSDVAGDAAGFARTPSPTSQRPRRVPRSDPGGLVAGLVIAGIGLFFLAGQVEPDIGRFVTLFIGLALLAVFVLRREYGFLVPGSILTGVGIGVALTPVAVGEADSGVMMLSIAGGFLGIWVLGSLYRLPQNHWWPLIPGGILTLIGLVQLSRTDVGGALRLWPVILIVAGALVLGRTITRRA